MNYVRDSAMQNVKTLTLIISTCNRCQILKKNLEKMLRSRCMDVEFLICDNASADNTWKYLESIDDDRVFVQHNAVNYGFENFWLVSEGVKTKFFMFVNDRDYIEPYEIAVLVSMLQNMDDVDFISNEKRNLNAGYYTWKDALDIYFQSRHPGTLIYNTDFIKKYMDFGFIKTYLEQGRAELANNYLVFQILLNVQRIYVYGRNPINQPLNRERIPKVRKEYYKEPYISLVYREKEYDDWIIKGLEHINAERTKDIMLAIYKDSIMTVTWEYYFSLKIPGMARRNGCEEHKAKEWKKNGILFMQHVLGNKNFRKFGLDKEILKETWKNYKETLWKVMEW